jgi:hypothetical protein
LLGCSDALGVPQGLQSPLTTFVGDHLILEGHIPEHVIAGLLATSDNNFEEAKYDEFWL